MRSIDPAETHYLTCSRLPLMRFDPRHLIRRPKFYAVVDMGIPPIELDSSRTNRNSDQWKAL